MWNQNSSVCSIRDSGKIRVSSSVWERLIHADCQWYWILLGSDGFFTKSAEITHLVHFVIHES